MKAGQGKRGGDSQDYEIPLLQEHFARIGRRLAAEGEAAMSFDHGTNRGQIREAFVRELLSHNTSPLTGIGTGEIIHSGSSTDQRRRQLDVVIHNNRYPKISLATGTDLFFIETVSSFVEIKSRLRKDHIRQAALAAKEIKTHGKLDGQRFTWTLGRYPAEPAASRSQPKPVGPNRITELPEVVCQDTYPKRVPASWQGK